MDYAASGKPVISAQETPEYINLLHKYNAGISIKNGDVEKLKSSLIYMADNLEITKKMGANHRRMGVDLFDRDIIYKKVIDIIESL
jgi:glycosyltransferase involved in cell wall biosynthesis